MKRFFAYRHIAATLILLASIAAVAFGAGLPIDTTDGQHLGFLALGIPAIGERTTCVLCKLAREQTSDYAPVEHFMGGPKRIILMRHADKNDGDTEDQDLSDAGMAREATSRPTSRRRSASPTTSSRRRIRSIRTARGRPWSRSPTRSE